MANVFMAVTGVKETKTLIDLVQKTKKWYFEKNQVYRTLKCMT